MDLRVHVWHVCKVGKTQKAQSVVFISMWECWERSRCQRRDDNGWPCLSWLIWGPYVHISPACVQPQSLLHFTELHLMSSSGSAPSGLPLHSPLLHSPPSHLHTTLQTEIRSVSGYLWWKAEEKVWSGRLEWTRWLPVRLQPASAPQSASAFPG